MCETIKGSPLGPRVKQVIPKDGHMLLLLFSNGEKRVFDAKKLFEIKVFEPLKDRDFFGTVKVEYGTVVWPDDIDYCPDTLYEESVPCEWG